MMTNVAWSNGELLDRAQFAAKAAECGVPEHCCDSLAGYITGDYKHIGGFLTALLSNDLNGTFARADDVNRYAIFNYLRFLHNHVPSGCWGSWESVSEWLERNPIKREAA